MKLLIEQFPLDANDVHFDELHKDYSVGNDHDSSLDQKRLTNAAPFSIQRTAWIL